MYRFTRRTIPLLFLFLCLSNFSFGQITTTEDEFVSSNTNILIPSQVEDNKYYLDLEVVEGHLSDFSIMDEENQVVLNTSLALLPSDALFELDLTEFKKGEYVLRIRTYTNEIKTDISIQ